MSTDKSADEFKAPGEKNKAEKQDAHERKVTADFLDDKGMITVGRVTGLGAHLNC